MAPRPGPGGGATWLSREQLQEMCVALGFDPTSNDHRTRRQYQVAMLLLGALVVGPRRVPLCRLTGVSQGKFNIARYWFHRYGVWGPKGALAYEWLEKPDDSECAVGIVLDVLVGCGAMAREGDRYRLREWWES